MHKATLALFVAAAGLAMTACNVAQPAIQKYEAVSMVVQARPSDVISDLRSQAMASGYRIADETADSLHIDFGVQNMTIPIPTEYGLWGSQVVFRETEVHSSAVYHVMNTAGGSEVVLYSNPIYWHPDNKVWLPGPHDMNPGQDLLRTIDTP